MPERTLREILDELHGRLEHSEDLDPRAREALRETAAEIQETLEASGSDGLYGELRDRLSEALARFEGEHPRLAETVRRLVDQLWEMGI